MRPESEENNAQALFASCSAHLASKDFKACAALLDLPIDHELTESKILRNLLIKTISLISTKEKRMEFLSDYAAFLFRYFSSIQGNPSLLVNVYASFRRVLNKVCSARHFPLSPPLKKLLNVMWPLLRFYSERNNGGAQYELAILYWNHREAFSEKFPDNASLLKEFLSLSENALQNNFPYAHENLARVYLSKEYAELHPHLSQDDKEALALPHLRASSHFGDGWVNFQLGAILFSNTRFSREERIELALPYYEVAAKKGVKEAIEWLAEYHSPKPMSAPSEDGKSVFPAQPNSEQQQQDTSIKEGRVSEEESPRFFSKLRRMGDNTEQAERSFEKKLP